MYLEMRGLTAPCIETYKVCVRLYFFRIVVTAVGMCTSVYCITFK